MAVYVDRPSHHWRDRLWCHLVADTLEELHAFAARLRLYRKLGYQPCPDEPYWDRSHPFYVLNDALQHDMGVLGKLCQKYGEEYDIRHGPMWALLEYRHRYEEAYERRRRVALDELTPRALYEGLRRGNRLYWRGWQVSLDAPRELTDDFGQPTWGKEIRVMSPGGETTLFRFLGKEDAREIYRHMTGENYDGDDGMGVDPPHSAECIPWWLRNVS